MRLRKDPFVVTVEVDAVPVVVQDLLLHLNLFYAKGASKLEIPAESGWQSVPEAAELLLQVAAAPKLAELEVPEAVFEAAAPETVVAVEVVAAESKADDAEPPAEPRRP